MALKPCVKCGHPIGPIATECPECGYAVSPVAPDNSVGTAPASPTCPKCDKDDVLQKLSAVVDGGVSFGSFSGPSLGIAYLDGQVGAMAGYSHMSGTLATDLARHVAPPPPPEPATGSGLWAIVMFAGGFAALFSWVAAESSETYGQSTGPILGVIAAALLISSVYWGFHKPHVYNQTVLPMKRDQWSAVLTVWDTLYYCRRDDVVFQPGGTLCVASSALQFHWAEVEAIAEATHKQDQEERVRRSEELISLQKRLNAMAAPHVRKNQRGASAGLASRTDGELGWNLASAAAIAGAVKVQDVLHAFPSPSVADVGAAFISFIEQLDATGDPSHQDLRERLMTGMHRWCTASAAGDERHIWGAQVDLSAIVGEVVSSDLQTDGPESANVAVDDAQPDAVRYVVALGYTVERAAVAVRLAMGDTDDPTNTSAVVADALARLRST